MWLRSAFGGTGNLCLAVHNIFCLHITFNITAGFYSGPFAFGFKKLHFVSGLNRCNLFGFSIRAFADIKRAAVDVFIHNGFFIGNIFGIYIPLDIVGRNDIDPLVQYFKNLYAGTLVNRIKLFGV